MNNTSTEQKLLKNTKRYAEYWTATRYKRFKNSAYFVKYGNHDVGAKDMSNKYYVRCVRGK